jgi:hypothetical protein
MYIEEYWFLSYVIFDYLWCTGRSRRIHDNCSILRCWRYRVFSLLVFNSHWWECFRALVKIDFGNPLKWYVEIFTLQLVTPNIRSLSINKEYHLIKNTFEGMHFNFLLAPFWLFCYFVQGIFKKDYVFHVRQL